jgi:glycosyltransferase involved in cell wall biosynthesis
VNIAFIFAPENVGSRPFDFNNLWDDPRGMTGTDSAILIFARELAKRGHRVALYIENPNAAEFDGVRLYDLRTLPHDGYDVVVSFVYSRFFRGMSPTVLRVNFQTCNSLDYELPNFEDDVDLFLSPSSHHCEYMQKWTLTKARKWEVMRLGCYVDDYGAAAHPILPDARVDEVCPECDSTLDGKIPGRVVHTSSPDRGLHLVLQEWPAILDAVPGATLKIFYHSLNDYIQNYAAVQIGANRPIQEIEHGCRVRYIQAALGRLKNVEVVGSISRNRMKRELSEAMVLAYPCETISYSEGFSVSTLEGCASGALPIIAGCDALDDVYKGVLPMVPHPARKHTAMWRDLVIKALTDEPWRARKVAVARDFALRHHYPDLAAELEGTFVRHIERKRQAPPVWTSQEKIPIDFILTPFAGGDDPIDPVSFVKESRGGGSRAGFMHLARAMGERSDYKVRAFAKFTRGDVSEGACRLECIPIDGFQKDDSNRKVLFAYYDTSALRDVHTGCLRIASHHTYVPPDIWFSNHCDLSTAPTEHAVNHLRRGFDPHGAWYVLPNGVADPFIEWKPVAGRVLYHGSPDRGLSELFSMWPAIRATVPEATLHVTGDVLGAHYGDMALFPSFARNTIGKRVMALREGLRVARASGGVELLGKVSRDLLRHELGQAACFAYPCSVAMPCETFSVCVMECLRAGVPVVLCPADALSFYDDIAMVTPNPIEEHRTEFVEAVVHVLRSPQRQLACHHMGRRLALRYTHQRMATVLDQIIRKNLQ